MPCTSLVRLGLNYQVAFFEAVSLHLCSLYFLWVELDAKVTTLLFIWKSVYLIQGTIYFPENQWPCCRWCWISGLVRLANVRSVQAKLHSPFCMSRSLPGNTGNISTLCCLRLSPTGFYSHQRSCLFHALPPLSLSLSLLISVHLKVSL